MNKNYRLVRNRKHSTPQVAPETVRSRVALGASVSAGASGCDQDRFCFKPRALAAAVLMATASLLAAPAFAYDITQSTDNASGATVGTLSQGIITNQGNLNVDPLLSQITVSGTITQAPGSSFNLIATSPLIITGGAGGGALIDNGDSTSLFGPITFGAGFTLTNNTVNEYLGENGQAGAYGGGTGGNGSSAIVGAAGFTLNNHSEFRGGAGGAGGSSNFNTGGNGGMGGAGVSGSGFTLTNSGTISGGNGGVGGLGTSGQGGAGGAGVSGSGFTLTNTGTITGGSGGVGAYSDFEIGGQGGAGGAGVSGSGFTLTNTGTITGGSGGVGGSSNNDTGGNGGAGSAGVSGSGFTLTNTGTITGGNGGAGGYHFSYSGNGGAGGAGVVASGNATITSSGTISGGMDGNGNYRANAVVMSGGGNTLVIGNGAVFNGSVVSDSLGEPAGDVVRLNAGSATVNGDLSLPANAILRVDVTNDTTYGKLVVNGTATLDAGVSIDVNVANPNFSFTSAVTGGMQDVLSATTLVADDSFTVTDNSLLFDFNAVKDANTIDLTLVQAASGNGVLESVQNTGNAPGAGAASMLDGLIDGYLANGTTGNPQMDAIMNTLGAFSTEQEVSDAVSQVLPLMVGGATMAMSNAMHGLNRIVQSRQAGQSGRSTGDEFFGDEYFWFKPFGSWADQDDRKGVSGFESDTYGVVFGADAEVSDSTRLGVALSYARSDVDGNSRVAPNSADVDSYQLMLYGSRDLTPETEISFQAGVGYHDTTGRRSVSLLLPGQTARSDFHSWSGNIGVGVAHTIDFSASTSFTPSVRMDYLRVDSQSYTEKGAGALNLDIDGNTFEELIFSVDGKLAHQLNERATVTANLGAGYDVINEDAVNTSAFAGTPGTTFVTRGLDPVPWMVRGGLGLVGNITETVEVTARYDIEVREDFDNQTASFKVRWAF